MPRLRVREVDKEDSRRTSPREDARTPEPRKDARTPDLREDGRLDEPREAIKRFPSQTGTNVSLTGGVREYQTALTSIPWRIFPSSKEESNQ